MFFQRGTTLKIKNNIGAQYSEPVKDSRSCSTCSIKQVSVKNPCQKNAEHFLLSIFLFVLFLFFEVCF